MKYRIFWITDKRKNRVLICPIDDDPESYLTGDEKIIISYELCEFVKCTNVEIIK